MKRYEMISFMSCGAMDTIMDEEEDGDWAKWEDVAKLRTAAVMLLNSAEHTFGVPFPQWLVDCRRDIEGKRQ